MQICLRLNNVLKNAATLFVFSALLGYSSGTEAALPKPTATATPNLPHILLNGGKAASKPIAFQQFPNEFPSLSVSVNEKPNLDASAHRVSYAVTLKNGHPFDVGPVNVATHFEAASTQTYDGSSSQGNASLKINGQAVMKDEALTDVGRFVDGNSVIVPANSNITVRETASIPDYLRQKQFSLGVQATSRTGYVLGSQYYSFSSVSGSGAVPGLQLSRLALVDSTSKASIDPASYDTSKSGNFMISALVKNSTSARASFIPKINFYDQAGYAVNGPLTSSVKPLVTLESNGQQQIAYSLAGLTSRPGVQTVGVQLFAADASTSVTPEQTYPIAVPGASSLIENVLLSVDSKTFLPSSLTEDVYLSAAADQKSNFKGRFVTTVTSSLLGAPQVASVPTEILSAQGNARFAVRVPFRNLILPRTFLKVHTELVRDDGTVADRFDSQVNNSAATITAIIGWLFLTLLVIGILGLAYVLRRRKLNLGPSSFSRSAGAGRVLVVALVCIGMIGLNAGQAYAGQTITERGPDPTQDGLVTNFVNQNWGIGFAAKAVGGTGDSGNAYSAQALTDNGRTGGVAIASIQVAPSLWPNVQYQGASQTQFGNCDDGYSHSDSNGTYNQCQQTNPTFPTVGCKQYYHPGIPVDGGGVVGDGPGDVVCDTFPTYNPQWVSTANGQTTVAPNPAYTTFVANYTVSGSGCDSCANVPMFAGYNGGDIYLKVPGGNLWDYNSISHPNGLYGSPIQYNSSPWLSSDNPDNYYNELLCTYKDSPGTAGGVCGINGKGGKDKYAEENQFYRNFLFPTIDAQISDTSDLIPCSQDPGFYLPSNQGGLGGNKFNIGTQTDGPAQSGPVAVVNYPPGKNDNEATGFLVYNKDTKGNYTVWMAACTGYHAGYAVGKTQIEFITGTSEYYFGASSDYNTYDASAYARDLAGIMGQGGPYNQGKHYDNLWFNSTQEQSWQEFTPIQAQQLAGDSNSDFSAWTHRKYANILTTCQTFAFHAARTDPGTVNSNNVPPNQGNVPAPQPLNTIGQIASSNVAGCAPITYPGSGTGTGSGSSPTVTLSAPASVQSGTSIQFTTTATNNTSLVIKQGSTTILYVSPVSGTTTPYAAPVPGTYSFVAEACNAAATCVDSPPVNVTVVAASGANPIAALAISPAVRKSTDSPFSIGLSLKNSNSGYVARSGPAGSGGLDASCVSFGAAGGSCSDGPTVTGNYTYTPYGCSGADHVTGCVSGGSQTVSVTDSSGRCGPGCPVVTAIPSVILSQDSLSASSVSMTASAVLDVGSTQTTSLVIQQVASSAGAVFDPLKADVGGKDFAPLTTTGSVSSAIPAGATSYFEAFVSDMAGSNHSSVLAVTSQGQPASVSISTNYFCAGD